MTKTLAHQPTRAALRATIASVAVSQLGAHEDPPGSNKQKYGVWYRLNGKAWCAIFVSWVYDQAAARVGCENPLAGLQSAKGFSGVLTGFRAAKRLGLVVPAGEPLFVGDVLCWDHGGGLGHAGVIVEVGKGWFESVEGNTDGSYSRTGGNVMRHRHTLTDGRHDKLAGVFRPTRAYGR